MLKLRKRGQKCIGWKLLPIIKDIFRIGKYEVTTPVNDLNAKAFDLAKIYLRFYKKATGRNLFSIRKFRGSKWWIPFFRTVSLFGPKKEWDALRFVEAQFSDRIAYPSQLATKRAWENFLEYRKRIIEDTDLYVANSCATVFRYIAKWSKLQGYSRPSYQAFLQAERENILRGSFTIHFFCILRPFYEFYERLDDSQKEKVATTDELERKRAVIHSIPKLSEKLKEVLGDDFV